MAWRNPPPTRARPAATPMRWVGELTASTETPVEDAMLARDVMTHPVVTVPATTGVAAASQTMVSHGYSALPVLDDDGRLIGIVTEADLLRNRIVDARPGGPATPLRAGATVGEVMTTPVESLTPGAHIADAARMMIEERIRCLPIVDGSGLVGIITRRDLLRAAVYHDDAAVREAILQRLRDLDPRDRWDVDVSGGSAVVADHIDDARDRRAVGIIAAAVPGVIRADVHYETCDPT